MRILYFADIRFPLERANGIQTMETCHALAVRGHQVALVVRPDVVAPPRDPFAFYGLAPLPALVIERAAGRGPLPLRRLMYLTFAIARALGPRTADVILTRDLGVAAPLLRMPGALRPPVVCESHEFSPVVSDVMPDLLSGGRRGSPSKQQRLMARERLAWTRADGYITTTAGLASRLERWFGRRPRVAAIPNGVRLRPDRQFRPPRVSDSPRVAYAGHLYPWKGVDVLIRALAELPGARGLVIGGMSVEPDLDRLKRLADELGVRERTTFAGFVEPARVASLLEEADILVLPNTSTPVSTGFTSPLKMFQYLAAGRPIVASDLPPLREVLRHGENAWLVEAGNPAALAAGLRRVLNDPALAERLAKQAFDEAERYSWDRRAERVAELLDEVVRGRREQGNR